MSVAMLDLPALPADLPAGENLELTAAFGELERAGSGKAEQQYGDLIVAAEEPDWKAIDSQAMALLATTRDLRILALLAVARLQLKGLPGYAGVLATIRGLLETNWPELHPQLDPEDDNDPTLRANALLRLADPARVMRSLRDLPLAASPRAGRISWRDIAVSAGQMEPAPDKEKLSEAVIRGVFAESDRGKLEALQEAITDAAASAVAIPAAFDARAGAGSGPDLTELAKLLREIGRAVDKYMPADAPPAMDDAPLADIDAPEEAAPSGGPAVRTASRAAPAPAMPTVANTRAEALRMLDLACDYYERNEPSSPLPLLLRRAIRLADLGFIDILRDLAPDGLGQAQIVTGVRDE